MESSDTAFRADVPRGEGGGTDGLLVWGDKELGLKATYVPRRISKYAPVLDTGSYIQATGESVIWLYLRSLSADDGVRLV